MTGTVSGTKIYSKISLKAGDLLKPRVTIYIVKFVEELVSTEVV
jgi:hypothetical protein